MTTYITTGIVFLLIIGFISMMVVQTRHKNAMRKREKLLQLSTQIKKLQNMQRTLPKHYLTPELREFLFDSIIYNYQQSIKLNPGNAKYLKSDLELVMTERQHHQQRPESKGKASPITDPNKANVARSSLKALHGFLIDSYKSKRINAKSAERLILHTELKLVESATEFFTAKAEKSLASKNFSEARALYIKAADSIKKSKHAEDFKQEFIQCNNRAKEIQIQWREYNSAKKEENAEQRNAEFEKWTEEQDDWKIKQDYD